MIDPGCRRSSVDVNMPGRVKFLRDSKDPKCTTPMTEMLLEPKLNLPKTDKAEPMRANVRSDKDDPKSRKSSTDKDEPNRPKDLSDIDDPICTKSSTDTEEPIADKPNNENVDPRRA
jgi:hypothetical protein